MRLTVQKSRGPAPTERVSVTSRLRIACLVLLVAIAGACGGSGQQPSAPAALATSSPSPLVTASPTATPTADPTPKPTPRPETDPADLARAVKHVKQLLAYGEIAGNAVLAGTGYASAKTTLTKMYALADEDRAWAQSARLSSTQRSALSEAIAAADAMELIIDVVKGNDKKEVLLLITLATTLSTWQSDLVALQ